MFSRMNIKWLAGIFLTLLLLAVIVVIKNNSQSAINRNRSFNSQLTDFDTSKVTRLIIYPKSGNDLVELKKESEHWKIVVDGKDYNADHSAIKGMMTSLISLTATRIAAKDKDQWDTYEVSDSAATRVHVIADKKTVADVYLGKFSYQQPKNPNPYMQQQGKMTSYVRIAGDNNVYAVDGIIAMSFSRQTNDFRNRTLIRSNKEDWNRLTFHGPVEAFNLFKQGENWMIDGLVADSASVARYLSSLAWLSSSDFIDQSDKLGSDPSYTLSIEGENMVAPVKVFAFGTDTSNKYAIVSSLNKDTYFSGSKSGLFDKIFVGKDHFFPTEEAVPNEE
ncbi:hypothetical protein ES703_26418 [subsurface metagenome]